MFSRIITSVYCALSLSILATAMPSGNGRHPTTTVTFTAPAPTHTASSCNTGPVQCCDELRSANDPATSTILGLLGVAVQGVDVPVGIKCSPITAVGVGAGNSCSSNAFCCQDNSYGGLVSIGCVPVKL